MGRKILLFLVCTIIGVGRIEAGNSIKKKMASCFCFSLKCMVRNKEIIKEASENPHKNSILMAMVGLPILLYVSECLVKKCFSNSFWECLFRETFKYTLCFLSASAVKNDKPIEILPKA